MSWTHLRTLMYLEMSRLERWSTRKLRAHLDGMLFEPTAISRKPEALIRQELQQLARTGEPSEDLVFRDPYVLDFLGLRYTFSEQDLERAILLELQRCLSELGSDFAFLPGISGSPSMARTTTSICSSTTGDSGGSW